jgi:hypothetical protein
MRVFLSGKMIENASENYCNDSWVAVMGKKKEIQRVI